jgi:hypothetical protein
VGPGHAIGDMDVVSKVPGKLATGKANWAKSGNLRRRIVGTSLLSHSMVLRPEVSRSRPLPSRIWGGVILWK